jgi:hypothetical protein
MADITLRVVQSVHLNLLLKSDLKNLALTRNLPVSGTKSDLILRLANDPLTWRELALPLTVSIAMKLEVPTLNRGLADLVDAIVNGGQAAAAVDEVEEVEGPPNLVDVAYRRAVRAVESFVASFNLSPDFFVSAKSCLAPTVYVRCYGAGVGARELYAGALGVQSFFLDLQLRLALTVDWQPGYFEWIVHNENAAAIRLWVLFTRRNPVVGEPTQFGAYLTFEVAAPDAESSWWITSVAITRADPPNAPRNQENALRINY